MSDKILIMGGANLHCKLVEAAHQLGKKTIVVDNIVNSPAKLISDYSYDIDVKDVDKLVGLCKRYNVRAVISAYLDFCQPYYQQVCSRLNSYCFGTHEQFRAFTDKNIFKRICKEYGINTIPGYTEEEISVSDEVQYPVYVKPAISQGSKGQTVCYEKRAAEEAVKIARGVSVNNEVVIEKYMQNKDIIQVTYLVIDGIPQLIRTADQINGSARFGMEHIAVAGVSPSQYTEVFLENTDNQIKKLIQGIGIKNGPVFMQGFVDDGNFYFFDPGLRFPGTEASRVFNDLMKIDLMQAMIEFAFTGKFSSLKEQINDETVYLNNYMILNLFPFVKQGQIKSMPSVDTILAIDGVQYATYRHKIGDIIADSKDVNQRIAEINILGKSKKQMNQIIEQLYAKLLVMDVYGNNMVFDKFIFK